jgi:hypothetical protein
MLQVSVTNSSSNSFNLPGFVLLAANGDTLAKEDVVLSGIATQSVHYLRIFPGAVTQGANPISGTLHLWKGFYQTFECGYPVTFTPCPPAPCSPLTVQIENYGSALVTEMFDWSLLDSAGVIVASGTLELNAPDQQVDSDTVCLEMGSYTLSLESPLITGGQLFYGVQDATYPVGVGIGSNYVQGASSNTFDFNHFSSCSNLMNGIVRADDISHLTACVHQGIIVVVIPGSEVEGVVYVHDISGRLLHFQEVVNNQMRISSGAAWPECLVVTWHLGETRASTILIVD